MNAERIAFEKAMKDRGEVSPATAARAGIVRLAKELRSNGPITDDDTWDGPEAQRVYEQFIAEPPSAQRDVSVDPHTCTFCRKVTTHRLQCCSRCKKQAYCTKECQVSHWKAHKKECIPIEELSKEDTKRLPLTWEQLEEFGVAPGKSLEVRFIHQEPHLRLIALCKDRAGICKRVAAYTESRTIPGFTTGKVLVWKNPRFHGFLDGSSGARIEEEDLVNIRIK
ncbi:hypothetical protein MPSEU_000203700 [Mayamaea pseudoterrestris]|nr:hypothetical protein MPSEU_000203700 [Mayamaea pseudoterrestris]